jgi:hypothetical protein
MKPFFMIVLACTFCMSKLALADEGMWLYNAPPKDKIKAKYGFELTQAWLDHVRLSSVRFNNGGSGSFVSPDGLTFTNHHVGAGCVQQLSTEGHDYIKTGFYAKTQAEEAKCPNLELNQLVGIEDVTDKINAGVKQGMSAADTGQAQRAAMSQVEKECSTSSQGLRCDVVIFYSGQVYNLYKYKKYTDVRLVFAPEFDMAFFGGDPDNFTYPRYDLDITFFRVYENGKPAHLDNYLKWSARGVKDGDLIFVSGHPGNTGRLLTMAQLEFLRDVQYPAALKYYARRIALLQNFSQESEENARIAKEDVFGLQNSQKAITGYQSGLLNKSIMDQKATDEAKLRASFKTDPKNAGTQDPWEEIVHAIKVNQSIYPNLTYLERMRGFPRLAQLARTLVRAGEEKPKANPDRLREFRDSALSSLEQQLFSTEPVYKKLEIVLLSDALADMQNALGNDNADVQRMLQGKSPAEAARDLISNTKLDDVAVRKQLYEGGQAAIEASTDPLIGVMRAIDPGARTARKEYEDKVESVVRRDGANIAKARFAQSGFTQPPDATFTLRLSYGQVKGYEENGKPIPFATKMGGSYEHAAEHNNQPPYNLPESWMKSKSKLNLKTPLNFVSTADIIGGNSGSPTVNQKGEVVGIIFDGNIESLPWNFAYSDVQGRALSVDSRGIEEALRKIYGATALTDELTETKASGASAAK